ncbi:MAG: hypothetical protein J5484_07300, partial [Prevotella sp.]|nr:hypothetical protein [Prevotella sp.]
MKKLLLLLLAMVAFSATADAQGFLKKLKDKALEKAKDKIENKVERTVDKEMDAVLDGKKSEKTSKAKKQAEDAAEEVDDTPDAVAQNQKSDFVRGSVILFSDDFANEQMGEFPSKWDVSEGSLETASISGKKYAHSNAPDSRFSPLMENMKSYLPEVFTLEWDEFFCKQGEIPDFPVEFQFLDASGNQTGHIYLRYRPGNPDCYGNYTFKKGGGIDQNVGG